MADINLKNIDADWYRKLKILAATEDVTVKQFILKAVSQYMTQKTKEHIRANAVS